MSKKIAAGIVILVFVAGLAGGFFAGHYKYVTLPQKQAEEAAKKQQEQLERMVRRGVIVDITPETLTVKVEEGARDEGKTVTYRVNEYSTVQIGMNFVSQPGKKTDLTKFFKKGDYVDLMVDGKQAVVVHREIRPEEA